jgi:hypothetical protein
MATFGEIGSPYSTPIILMSVTINYINSAFMFLSFPICKNFNVNQYLFNNKTDIENLFKMLF